MWPKDGWILSILTEVAGSDFISLFLTQSERQAMEESVQSSGSKLGDNSDTCWEKKTRGPTSSLRSFWQTFGKLQYPEFLAGNKQPGHRQRGGARASFTCFLPSPPSPGAAPLPYGRWGKREAGGGPSRGRDSGLGRHLFASTSRCGS